MNLIFNVRSYYPVHRPLRPNLKSLAPVHYPLLSLAANPSPNDLRTYRCSLIAIPSELAVCGW